MGIGAAGGLAALLLCVGVMSAIGGESTPTPEPVAPVVNNLTVDNPAPPVPPPVVTTKVIPPAPQPEPVPEPEVKPEPARGIDLIALVTQPNPLNKGVIRKLENKIVTGKATRWDVAVAPVEVPDEYTVELIATSSERPDSLHLGLLVGGKPSSFIVDGFEGSRSGPFVLKGRGMTQPDYAGYKGTLMKVNEPFHLKITVTPRSIEAWANDQPFFRWQGEPTDIDWNMTYQYPKEPCLTVGSWNCPFEILQWTLIPGPQ